MGIVEEIRSMQAQGIPQEEIVRILQNKGVSMSDINNYLSQAKIKQAVNQDSSSTEISGEELHPSISSQQIPEQSQQEETLIRQPTQSYQTYEQQTPAQYQEYANYQGYDPYSSGISSDTINEIAEQVVLEKLSPLRDKLEQALEFKNIIEIKISYIDERLKRMEKIIDKLQLSVLQKVGEYITNVEDIKKEMQETQKSFKSLLQKPSQQKDSSQQPTL